MLSSFSSMGVFLMLGPTRDIFLSSIERWVDGVLVFISFLEAKIMVSFFLGHFIVIPFVSKWSFFSSALIIDELFMSLAQ